MTLVLWSDIICCLIVSGLKIGIGNKHRHEQDQKMSFPKMSDAEMFKALFFA